MVTFTRLVIPVVVACTFGSIARAQTAVVIPPTTAALERAMAVVAQATPASSALAQAAVEQALAEVQAAAQATAVSQAAASKSDQEQAVRKQAAKLSQQAAELREQGAELHRQQAVYAKGTAALDAGRWSQALEAFTEALALKGSRADGALYWKAYAEYKLAQRAAALATLQALQTQHPSSNWVKEARALEVELSGAAGAAATAGGTSDDELKLLAINSLIHSESEQVVPMLEKILTGPHTPQLKKRALFVLAQSQSPKAREVLLAAAKGAGNPDLQLDALQYLGMFGGSQNTQALSDIYAASKDVDVKRRILESYMIGGQRDRLVQAARGESIVALRGQAVRMLGAMHATAELDTLYRDEKEPSVKRAIVEAYMVGGDAERLAQVAKTDGDQAMRLRAIEMLGAMGRSTGTAVLGGLYAADGQSRDVRRAVINGLFIAGDVKSLIDIARKETDPDLRKAAVERLSLMKSKDATDFLMELINK
jgi:tetratricopeptide (TPR) repeat protein